MGGTDGHMLSAGGTGREAKEWHGGAKVSRYGPGNVDSLFPPGQVPRLVPWWSPIARGNPEGRGGDQRAATNVNLLCTDPDAAGV